MMTIGAPKFAKDHAVANKLQKRSLLIAVNLVAGLSIFFFGYDQGVMGGVNTNRNYAQLMGFGQWDESAGEVVVNKPLLQGGIVSSSVFRLRPSWPALISPIQIAVYYLPGTLYVWLELSTKIRTYCWQRWSPLGWMARR